MAAKFDPILGKLRQDDAPGSEITGTLTANYIPKATAAAVIGNSSIQDDGTDVTFGEDLIFATGKALKTGTTDGNTYQFLCYDVDAAGYATMATITAGNTPSWLFGNNVTFQTGTGIETQTSSGNTVLFRAYDSDGAAYTTVAALVAADNPHFLFNESYRIANGKAIQTTKTAAENFYIQAYDVDGAAYTTMATLTAGNTPTMDLHASAVTIGSAYIYRVGGTDVSLADGGTGASLVDPNADRIMFWDDSATSTAYLAPAGEIVISTTNMYVPAASLYLYDNFI